MSHLSESILHHAASLPEGGALSAKGLLHLGARPAVDQALSRLVRRGHLLRAGRGLYTRPIRTRFGSRPPTLETLVEGLARAKGETLVPHGAAAANALGLTTQVPVRTVYLTSGRTRTLQLGAQQIELRHAPAWQLMFPGAPAGEAVRALAWLGEAKAGEAMRHLRRVLPPSALAQIADARTRMPTWLAAQVSRLIAHA
ncbi:DUF6088 family protein [Hephaestia sp. GCM10023244]|uniref:DUF6088 family protein n=1 Tax=unclassified Hephaestia TaxID=2631281 RepID=UPI002076FE8C|nr:DUF6088 family protein [Hephaestia sp. MAHUQ-44]MCM8731977.1 DUF6088 family protein [Hephaestia sp. MAHUQ-44]